MKVGDKVVWFSSWTEKRGVVIADIPAGTSAMRHIPAGAKKSHSKIDKDKSAIDRMLVAVKAGKYGQITHYYAPRKSLLNVVEDAE
ncbi:MAG: hypothetical protein HFH88_17680 [Lachnospiraceae bacterium]|nr:hypothetical protein [Lachnospiraceae bacterium]